MKKKLERYHLQVFVPPWYDEKLEEFSKMLSSLRLVCSYHATKKYSKMSRQYKRLIKYLLETFTINSEESKSLVFEFYSDDKNNIKKVCYRFPTELDSDIIFVVSSTGKIVTIYLNKGFDPHITLDKRLYKQGDLANEGEIISISN